MKRFEDWPIRLNAAIEAARGRPFVWGQHDCALFAFNVVRDLTGIDHASAYRGHYKSAQGAARALRTLGQGTLRASVGAALGGEIPALKAQRGDVVLRIQPSRGETLGICTGADVAFVGGPGLVFVPVSDCLTAWRV